MGRPSTGVMSTTEADTLNISVLVKGGAIKKGEELSGSINFPSGSSVSFRSKYTAEEIYLELSYKAGENNRKERIELATLPSNLGKGEILYFVCPVRYELCRILYRAYNSETWKSREAYRNRIYYPLQLHAKVGRENSRYWYYERKLEHLYKQRQSYYFKGRPTKRLQRVEGIEGRRDEANEMRFTIGSFQVWFQKLLRKGI